MRVCVHECVRKKTFHVCVFQDKSITRITLMYQVDVCVDVCVLMCVCVSGKGLKEKDMVYVCVCVHVCVRKRHFICACLRKRA